MIKIKQFNDIKITTGIILIGILGVISASLIGILGYEDIQKMNNNISSIYTNDLDSIEKESEMLNNFQSIKVEVTKQIRNYNEKANSKIELDNEKLNKNLSEYIEKNIDESQKDNVDKVASTLKEYMSSWNEIKILLENRQSLSVTKEEQIYAQGDITTDSLSNLIYEDKLNAEKEYYKSQKIYKESLIAFISIVLISLLVLAAIVVLIITVVKKSSKEIIGVLNTIAQGNFNIKLNTESTNEFGVMKKALNTTVKNVAKMISEIKYRAENINHSSEVLYSTSEEMTASANEVARLMQVASTGSSNQAGDLMEITHVLSKFNQSIDAMVKAIEDVDKNSNNIEIMTGKGEANIKILTDSVNKVMKSSNDFTNSFSKFSKNIYQINEITNIINGIANQTNLLALNASIEAARSGEYGKGFSVVAEEIKKLAEESKISSENIGKLIAELSNGTQNVLQVGDTMNNELINQKGVINDIIDSFGKIILAVNDNTPKIQLVATFASNINEEKDSILKKVENSSSIAEKISASSEEISASSEEMNACAKEVSSTAQLLNNIAEETMDELNKFKL